MSLSVNLLTQAAAGLAGLNATLGHRVDELRRIIELECGNIEKIEADVMELAAIVDFETIDDAESCMHKVSIICYSHFLTLASNRLGRTLLSLKCSL